MIIASPETVSNPEFKDLCYSSSVWPHLFSIIFDEGHHISQWGDSFWLAYARAGNIYWLVPPKAIFYITSATLPNDVLVDILNKLHLTPEQVTFIIRSSDRPNVYLEVLKMQHPQNSYCDLCFLLPHEVHLTSQVPDKFFVFFNSQDETEECVKYFLTILPPALQIKVVWLHAGMTNEFCEACIEKLKSGHIWGICCTDAVGMVMLNELYFWKAHLICCCMD